MTGHDLHQRAQSTTAPYLEPRTSSDEAPLLVPDDVIDGHYEVRRMLGSGGMAQVYLGFDRWLDREVAIKVTPFDLAAHLEREARLLSRFRHPGLVTAHAYGHYRRLRYVVLDYLDGQPLSARIEHRRGWAVDDALRLVVGICEALAPLHERGLVHCDLKPGNIMCVSGQVVLIDLGIAWDTRSERREGGFLGSPPFMPPEAIMGSVRMEQAHLIDVYAVGMILYGLLAGGTPFDADPAQIMRRQLEEEAPTLSSVRADLPPRLAEIVASLIDRDPNARPSSIVALRDAIIGIPRRSAVVFGHETRR